MSLSVMPSTEWAGAVLILIVGVPLSARCFWHAWVLRRYVRKWGGNGELRLIARRDLRGEAVGLAVQLILLVVSLWVAIGDHGRGFPAVGRAAISALVAWNSLMNLWARRQLLAMKPGLTGGRASADVT